MHKSKKKSKTEGKVPKPIKIKKEKTEEDRTIHAISHYVDDRLELVKQIFGTLKPKTITNLAPDFLKNKNLEEIEELCLNELICISKKRLLSIINATKCPSDTESSEDSDVQHQEEHVSLEEISSDSEIEGAASSAGKKRSSGNKNADAGKRNTKGSTENNDENPGHISVLELLELQARARAIRSQLALEPVTKIEVESDDGAKPTAKDTQTKDKKDAKDLKNSKATKASKDSREKRSERKRKSSEEERTGKSATNSNQSVAKSRNENIAGETSKTTSENEAISGSKKIKLKRNYRIAHQEKSMNDDITSKERKETTSNSVTANAKDIKREEKSHSPSPDVIPIIPVQETLLISDDSSDAGEDEEQKATKTKPLGDSTAEMRSAADSKAVTKRVRKETASEEGEITDGENDDENMKDEENNLGANIDRDVAKHDAAQAPNEVDTDANASRQPNCDNSNEEEEQEQQEESVAANIKENNNENADKSLDSNESSSLNSSAESTTNDNSTTTTMQTTCNENIENDGEQQTVEVTADQIVVAADEAEIKVAKKHDNDDEKDNKDNEDANVNDEDEDDDRNDDVISIGGDLESEMIEALEEETIKKGSFSSTEKEHTNAAAAEQDDDDIISLESSEDEAAKEATESWHARYLKSSKVSKVLATSRLSKRVRDRIKISKHSKKESSNSANLAETSKAANEAFSSKHEDGSIEQYKELLQMRQRKN